MRLIPLPRRHRWLWIIALILGMSAWGSWLAATGHTTSYRNTVGAVPATTSSQLSTPSQAHDPVVSNEESMTSAASVPASGDPSLVHIEPVAQSAKSVPDFTAGLAHMTDPVAFAAAVAHTLFAYDADTDFAARREAVLAVAALPPLGSPVELAADITAFTPDSGAIAAQDTVRFAPTDVATSPWAAAQIDHLRLADGAFGIDVHGLQTVTDHAGRRWSQPVVAGITGACPPALAQCEIDRVFPQTLELELAR